MIKAILLDMDNTLLRNPDKVFAMGFLRAAEAFFSNHWQFDGFTSSLRQSIKAINSEGKSPRQANHQLTLYNLAEAAERSLVEAEEALQLFYSTAYIEHLKNCIQPVDGAHELINTLLAEGYAVVIATNPLYPLEAVQWRLKWAGLPANVDDYAFITHAENMHFAKPHPAYFAEILARVGIEPDETVMIGDSDRNDIHPAGVVGIHTYKISEEISTNQGTLAHFTHAVFSEKWLENLIPLSLKPGMIKPQYLGNIAALFGMLEGLPDHYWNQHPDPQEWSPLQIVCHLYESENKVQRPRLQQILTQDNPFLAAPKPPPDATSYRCVESGPEYAHKFADSRQKTLDFLLSLRKGDWSRPARHSIFGPTTLLEMAHFTAQHDRLHLNQLCQTLGNCE